MKVALSTGAEQDLLDGFEFYEFQQTHLGWYFLDSRQNPSKTQTRLTP